MDNNLTNNYVRVFNPQNPANPYPDILSRTKNQYNITTGSKELYQQSLIDSLQPFPQEFVRVSPTRNAMFFFPSAGITPMTIGVAGSPPVGAFQPIALGTFFTAGVQVNTTNNSGN